MGDNAFVSFLSFGNCYNFPWENYNIQFLSFGESNLHVSDLNQSVQLPFTDHSDCFIDLYKLELMIMIKEIWPVRF